MGKDVTVVEALPDILGGPHGGIPFKNYDMLKDLVKYNEIKVMTASYAKEVTESGLLVEHDGRETLIDADTIIFSVGYRSNNSLYSKVENLADEVYLLGDAKNVRNIMFAIWDAYEIARQI